MGNPLKGQNAVGKISSIQAWGDWGFFPLAEQFYTFIKY